MYYRYVRFIAMRSGRLTFLTRTELICLLSLLSVHHTKSDQREAMHQPRLSKLVTLVHSLERRGADLVFVDRRRSQRICTAHATTARWFVGGRRTRSAKAGAVVSSSIRSATQESMIGPYGLKMVDYKNSDPQIWTLPPHPPMKGSAGSRQRAQYLAPLLAATALLGMAYIYFNADEDMLEYWRQVEQGNVPLDGFDDDLDDDDEWEDDEDEKK